MLFTAGELRIHCLIDNWFLVHTSWSSVMVVCCPVVETGEGDGHGDDKGDTGGG